MPLIKEIEVLADHLVSKRTTVAKTDTQEASDIQHTSLSQRSSIGTRQNFKNYLQNSCLAFLCTSCWIMLTLCLNSFEAHWLKSKSFGWKTFGKTILDKKHLDISVGIFDKETLRQTRY